jgi:hypothetical protein
MRACAVTRHHPSLPLLSSGFDVRNRPLEPDKDEVRTADAAWVWLDVTCPGVPIPCRLRRTHPQLAVTHFKCAARFGSRTCLIERSGLREETEGRPSPLRYKRPVVPSYFENPGMRGVRDGLC